MEAHAEEQNLQSPTEEVPQKSPELKAVPIVVEKENEDIAPALAGDALMNDDNQHANVGATSRNSLQFENNKDEPSGFAAEDKGLVYKNLNMQQTGKRTPSSVASQAVFNPPSADLGEIARNETKTTYLLDLKVIDYTEIYENQEEQNRRLHTTGVDAKYANKKEKMERAGSDEQVIDSVMYIDVLKESLASFKTGAYEKSLEDFSIILRKHPDELNAKFYGGLAYFEMGDYESALKNFDFVIEHPIPVFNPESEWYKAQSLVRLGNLKMAKDLLEKIIIEKGFYAEKARQLLDEIR
jgi:tetratricopeptide (TPR) repeat protein